MSHGKNVNEHPQVSSAVDHTEAPTGSRAGVAQSTAHPQAWPARAMSAQRLVTWTKMPYRLIDACLTEINLRLYYKALKAFRTFNLSGLHLRK